MAWDPRKDWEKSQSKLETARIMEALRLEAKERAVIEVAAIKKRVKDAYEMYETFSSQLAAKDAEIAALYTLLKQVSDSSLDMSSTDLTADIQEIKDKFGRTE
jgi:hypothetical protein